MNFEIQERLIHRSPGVSGQHDDIDGNLDRVDPIMGIKVRTLNLKTNSCYSGTDREAHPEISKRQWMGIHQNTWRTQETRYRINYAKYGEENSEE